jgi:hypothetical protein
MKDHKLLSIVQCKSLNSMLTSHHKPTPGKILPVLTPVHSLTGHSTPSLPHSSPMCKELCTYLQSLIKTAWFTFGQQIFTSNVTLRLVNNFLTGILLTNIFHHTNYHFLSRELGLRIILSIIEGNSCTDWLG